MEGLGSPVGCWMRLLEAAESQADRRGVLVGRKKPHVMFINPSLEILSDARFSRVSFKH